MRFQVGGISMIIQGDPSLSTSLVSLKTLWKAMIQQGKGILVELGCIRVMEMETEARPKIPIPFQKVLNQFQMIFDSPTGLPPRRSHDHAITLLPGTPPINVRPYRYPQFQKAKIERLVKEMLAACIIQLSTSPYSSLVLLVRKKDGGWCFYVDYRVLNKAIVADKFPLPMIDELLDELHGATIFSKLDLRSSYHQISVLPSDVTKTSFRTHKGYYDFLIMPFGLTNAPSTFQAIMNGIFRDCLRKFVLVFFDDILVCIQSIREHQKRLSVVLQVLEAHLLFANPKKCRFAQSNLKYLGHIIYDQGVVADVGKVEVMLKWPIPRSLKELRGFLGLTEYYRCFVANYGSIAWPLTQLLQKDHFHWGPKAEFSFQSLMIAMTQLPVLALPNFSKPFIVKTDASGTGI